MPQNNWIKTEYPNILPNEMIATPLWLTVKYGKRIEVTEGSAVMHFGNCRIFFSGEGLVTGFWRILAYQLKGKSKIKPEPFSENE